mmetsp:Transcript_109522/g.315417  ORF Transcript_109522/g.315417 Transcript_109522/m.315417 type:complete len:82 (+) Transcript_109522:332-577(+)
MKNVISKSSNAAFFNCNQNTMVIGKLPYQIDVQRLHESSICDCHAQSVVQFFDFIGGNQRFVEARAKCKNSYPIFSLLTAS